MAIGKPSKGLWRFIIIATLLSLVLVIGLVLWRGKKASAEELKALQTEANSLKKKVHTLEKGNAEEEKKAASALAEVDRLKEYQVTLLDSIQKLQPKPKPDTKKDEKKTVTAGTGRRKPGNSSNCQCPPATRANTQTVWAKYGIPTP